MLDEILSRYERLPSKAKDQLKKDVDAIIGEKKWIPNPGPQTQAYFSEADIVLFGGEPGGGKSALLVGLAFNCHERALLMRRQYTDLDNMVDYALQVNGSRTGFNGSPPPRLTHENGVIDFGACAKIGDEQHFMGRPHDLLGIDEATQFAAKQIRFLRGWLRSTTGKKTRTVLATNPPLSADGLWVFEWFAPWINPQFPDPAKPGELRWACFDDDDKPVWVSGPGKHAIGSRMLSAESLTYIPSKLEDNPFYETEEYQRKLDALPAEQRGILLGGFRSTFKDQDFQLLPTAWIVAAQERWTPLPPKGIPLCALGVDVASGGEDNTVIARRHDFWFAELIKIAGKDTPLGSDVAGRVFSYLRDDATVAIDMGGGYGGGPYELLQGNGVRVFAYKGAEGSAKRTKDGKLGFWNLRAEAHWRLRELLDPDQPGGSPVSLPPDPELLADLTAAVYSMTPRGIKITPKEELVEKLGRSPDKGDAVVMAAFCGVTSANVKGGFARKSSSNISVNLGRFGKRKR